MRSAFVLFSTGLLATGLNVFVAAIGVALLLVLNWKVRSARKDASKELIVPAGASAEPGTTNLMSPGASTKAAVL